MEENDLKQYLEECKRSHPLGRVGTPEDVANMIMFLVSDKASWVTGGIFPVDGGRNLVIVPNANESESQVSNFGGKRKDE